MNQFQDSISLHQKYYLFWNITSDGKILFGVSAQTNGWVGLGLSPNGGMKGADLWTVRLVDGRFVVEDRFSSDFATPLIDPSQELQILWASRDKNATSFIIERQLDSCDSQYDLDIFNKSISVMYAISYADSDQFYQHGAVRGSIHLNFFMPKAPPVPPTDLDSFTLRAQNFTIPDNQSTTYICQGYTLERNVTTKVHAVYIQNIVDNPLVHHMILYLCDSPSSPEIHQCVMESNCAEFFAIYARGAPDYVPPEGVGIPISPGQKYFMLQQHYENTNLLPGVVDSSGFRVFFTSNLRAYDQGNILLGNLVLNIPPNVERYEVTGECPSSCTDLRLPPAGITVLNVGYHMHTLGYQGWTQVIRNGTELAPIGTLNRYDFNFQTFWDIQPYKLYPGDRLITHCVWNSQSRPVKTLFGEGSADEMCFDILVYYPKIEKMGTCIQVSETAMCGDSVTLTMQGLTLVPLDKSPFKEYITSNCSVPSMTNRTIFTIPTPTTAPTRSPIDSNSSANLIASSLFLCFTSLLIYSLFSS